ncbi:dihydrodipicolinate synthase family protein [Micromonospora sp. DT63]|uniref:dihydrodipicolinate synthase family protein n=1 Tax=Micromonospora sp. DT63 TaxID=3393441 RepID=UPI003CEC7D52
MTLTGLYVPLITPFDLAGGVAIDALAALANDALDAGAAGVVALGTTGEPAALSDDERGSVLDVLSAVCRARRAHLLVGANTVEALRALSDRPEVTAALSLVPPFLRPGGAGVLAHFAHLAQASPVPLVVYHVPYRTGQQLSPDDLRQLAGLPGVIGIKYATGGIDGDTVDFLADIRPGFAVLGGEDPLISPLLALGAHGAIVASAQVAPADFVQLVALWQAGDLVRGRALGHRLAGLSAALFAEPNPTVIKSVLHAQGRIPTAGVRLPLVPAGPDAARRALRHLDELTSASR